MMKTMLGLAVGACASAGKLNVARATLETSKLPILRLIFMISDPPLRILIGHWPTFSGCSMQIAAVGRCPSPPAIAEVVPLRYRSANFRRPAFTRYAISAEMFLIKSF
jgi:hypothetical protein